MKKNAAILLLMLLPSLLLAQSITESKQYSHKTYIYKLSFGQAWELYKRDSIDIATNLFTNLFKVEYTDSVNHHDSMPPGHYLILKAQQGDVNFHSEEIKYFDVKNYGYNKEVWIVISDYKGKMLTDVDVKIKEKSYAYNPDCGCYPIPHKEAHDTMILQHNGQFSFYRLSSESPGGVRYKTSQYKYRRGGLWSDVRILPGYVAFNKPLYKPGDTVKVKAFLVNEKGRPWKRKVKIRMVSEHNPDVYSASEILRPVTDGAYVWEYPVPDTLEIEKYYHIEYRTPGKKLLRLGTFRVEEYNLKNNTFDAKLKKAVFKKGDPVSMYLSATDVNNLPLLDARTEIRVQMQKMRDFYGNTFFLPDKWKTNFYSKDFLLDVSGKTEVGIPDSLFGNAILDFSSTVLLANSDNESQNFNFNFTYDASHDDFRLKLNGDTVVAEYYCMSQPDNSRKAVLTSYFGESEIEKKEVSLPFQEKLNYAATSYRLQSVDGEELRRIATPAKILKLVYFKGKRTCDSISISLHNELQIPVSYQVFRETTKIDGGRSSSYAWATSDKSIDSYYVIYTFRWQDRDYTLERSFHIMEKELQVRINQPEVIYPGAQIPVSIHVSDYKNQPMEDVNLTAWSVNMQFEEIPLPAMPYFGKVHYELLAPFTTYATALSADGKRPINRKYIDLIHLRETPFYNLIYADNGVGIEYDSINSTWAEFAPFVYSKKRNRQIYTIYLDNEPVYIYGTNYTPPFSFKVKPGTYEVKLRTIDNLFTIRNVTIKPGVKSFVCLNVDSAYANANVSYVSLKDSSFYMQSEQELLKKYILLLDPIGVKEVFLEQDSLSTAFKKTYNEKKLYINDFGGYFKLGPIKKGLINITNQRNDTAYSFYFEPGYLYSLHDDSTYFDQPILYPNPLTGIVFSEREIPWNFNDQSIEVPVIIKEKYEASDNEYISEKRTYKPRHPLLKKYSQKGSYLSENCRLKFMFPKGAKIEWMGLFNHENDSATSVVFRKDDDFSDLKPGKYDVFIFYEDSSYYLLKNHELLADGINYVRYDTTLINGYDQEITDYYEKEVIRLNKPPLKKFTTPPHIFGKENVEVSYSRTPDGSTMISGYYLDYHGMPENNAIIYAEIQGIFKAGAVTNEEGYFEIHNVPAGNYMFNIHYYDSRPAYIYNVRVDAGRNTEVVFRHPFVLFESYSYYESNANEYSNSLSDVVVAEYQASVLDASSASYSRVLYSEISRVPGLSISSLQRVENFANLDMTDQLKNKDILDADALAALKSDPRSNRIRRNFRDYGFWVPNMLTDKNGNAAFTVEFPDNITQWKTIVAAMNDKMQSGIGTTQSKSYKPLSAHLGVPSYLVAGDSILAIGKLLNYTGVAIPVKTWFELDGTTMLSGNQAPVNSLKETIPVCLHNPGEFRLVYGLQKDDGYMDGEQRILEVMPDGVTKTRAQLLKLNSDTVVNLPKDESLLKRSLLVTNNPLDLIKQELKSLKDYEHGCNEQTASKLKALLLEKKLSAHLESEFEGEKDIDKHLKTLEKNQLEDGSWGWWGKNTADIWITMYITDAINRAVIDGYRTKAHIKGATFLKTKLDQLPVSRQLEVLNLLASIPFPMDYSAYMDKFSHHRLSLQDSLQYIRFLQLQDSSVSVEPVISSLIKDEDGIYWGEELFDVKVNIFQTSMLAYKILKTAGGHEDLLARIRSFFLNYKTKPRNTIEQATMLENFVTDMMKESTLQQQLTGTVKINDSILGTNYPYTLSFFDPANIRIEKTGAPLRIFVQDAVLERNPESVDSLISLKTYFIQEKERGDTLRTAANCTLTVEVINQKPLEYAFIEVPLPAGFIYGQNNSGMNESYRKQYNHKTVIACTRLPAGKHLFTIVLTPRFEGTFTLLPATIYPMYFPQNSVYSHSRKIVVNSEK